MFCSDPRSLCSLPNFFRSDRRLFCGLPNLLRGDRRSLCSNPNLFCSDRRSLRSFQNLLRGDRRSLRGLPNFFCSDRRSLRSRPNLFRGRPICFAMTEKYFADRLKFFSLSRDHFPVGLNSGLPIPVFIAPREIYSVTTRKVKSGKTHLSFKERIYPAG